MRRHHVRAGRKHGLVLPPLRAQEYQDRKGQKVVIETREAVETLKNYSTKMYTFVL